MTQVIKDALTSLYIRSSGVFIQVSESERLFLRRTAAPGFSLKRFSWSFGHAHWCVVCLSASEIYKPH